MPLSTYFQSIPRVADYPAMSFIFVHCFLLFHGKNIHKKDILEGEKTNPVCFLLRQESPIQKSATPQGLPPPTQQIKIQMQTKTS